MYMCIYNYTIQYSTVIVFSQGALEVKNAVWCNFCNLAVARLLVLSTGDLLALSCWLVLFMEKSKIS